MQSTIKESCTYQTRFIQKYFTYDYAWFIKNNHKIYKFYAHFKNLLWYTRSHNTRKDGSSIQSTHFVAWYKVFVLSSEISLYCYGSRTFHILKHKNSFLPLLRFRKRWTELVPETELVLPHHLIYKLGYFMVIFIYHSYIYVKYFRITRVLKINYSFIVALSC